MSIYSCCFFHYGRLYFSSLNSSLSSKSYNSAWQQHDGAEHWCFGSIAQVSFTAVEFAFGDVHRGVVLCAVLRAACRWLGTSFGKEFRVRLAWDDLTFYILFSTTVPTVRTDYRYFTVLAVIPALNRETLVAFQGITWKKETNIKIDLIAWISKTDTPNYPIVTIQYFCFSTLKPFGIKWILNLCPSPHFFRQAFLTEKRAKCWTNF